MKRMLGITGLLIIIAQPFLWAQSSPLRFEQTEEGGLPTPLSAEKLATLGDPLFNLLLKNKADTVTLSAVLDAIQPDVARRHLFAVSETIVDSRPQGTRRAVVAFDGRHVGEELQGNVALSIFFGPPGFDEITAIEGWGWDNHRGRYNYYKLDSRGGPPGAMTWKLRDSSENADLRGKSERKDTCSQCHVVGAPVMKELFFPWNNWHAGKGGSFKAEYLMPDSALANKWPAATTPPFQRLTGADALEQDFMLPALRRFNLSRLNSALKRDDATGNRLISPAGRMTVQEGRRLLRPLFETREINLISSRHTTGLPPFSEPTDFDPTLPIQIPDSFFLNRHVIAGGGLSGLGGLKLTVANQFSEFAVLTQQENKELVEQLQLRLKGVSGDTRFGWFTPEPSFVDNNLVDQALQLGAVTPHFVAAVLAVDVETPVLSAARAGLLQFVPDQFEFTPVPAGGDPLSVTRDAARDLLTQAVIANIDQSNPASGTPADEFRTLLSSTDAVTELQTRVQAYVDRVKHALASADPTERRAELKRLYIRLVERRRQMRIHPVLKHLDETEGQLLFPIVNGQ